MVQKIPGQLNRADLMAKYLSGGKTISDMEKFGFAALEGRSSSVEMACNSEDALLGGAARLACESRRSFGTTGAVLHGTHCKSSWKAKLSHLQLVAASPGQLTEDADKDTVRPFPLSNVLDVLLRTV